MNLEQGVQQPGKVRTQAAQQKPEENGIGHTVNGGNGQVRMLLIQAEPSYQGRNQSATQRKAVKCGSRMERSGTENFV